MPLDKMDIRRRTSSVWCLKNAVGTLASRARIAKHCVALGELILFWVALSQQLKAVDKQMPHVWAKHAHWSIASISCQIVEPQISAPAAGNLFAQ
jgi:hypothetical protein